MIKKHNTFVLNGKTINIKTKLKRQITPNFVNKWAERNSVDLRTPTNDEVLKRKKRNQAQQEEKIPDH